MKNQLDPTPIRLALSLTEPIRSFLNIVSKGPKLFDQLYQLGFRLHVALTLFTSYLVGYTSFRALFGHTPAMSAVGGILGLVVGMLVETLLFTIGTSSQGPNPSNLTTSTSKLKKN
ncbi:hypothetical protein K2173_011610 [Erythroxylum novogranatense]|uniref:Uncharacterized protein n=1 Tax=Erythroxylum novogranatense TaxID=1862640 RepID=A0AAV8U642_9ROSI|nr:hypothetical protein K2173_011610 [Erythroxylum novogranatense]